MPLCQEPLDIKIMNVKEVTFDVRELLSYMLLEVCIMVGGRKPVQKVRRFCQVEQAKFSVPELFM